MIQIFYLIFFAVLDFLVYYLFVRDFIISKRLLFGMIGFAVLFTPIQYYYCSSFGMSNDQFFNYLRVTLLFLLFFSVAGIIIESSISNDGIESRINNTLFHLINFFRTRIIFVIAITYQIAVILGPY